MKKLKSNYYLIIFESEITGETKEIFHFSKNIDKLAIYLRYNLFNKDDVVNIKIFEYIKMLYDEEKKQ